MNNEKNIEMRRTALTAYLRFAQEIYRSDTDDFLAALEIISERREMHPDDGERMLSLEGDVAVWATENTAIRTGLMTDFAETALAAAGDAGSDDVPDEIVRISEMDDGELRRYIAAQVEKIKYKRRMRGNKDE